MTEPLSSPGQPTAPGAIPSYPDPTSGVAGYGAYPPAPIPGQQGGFELAGPGIRFGAFLLNIVLLLVTLVIGWVIWSLIVYKDAKTPSWQILHLQAVSAKTGEPLTYGQTFLRNFVLYGLIGALGPIGFLYRVVGGAFAFNDDKQALWDKMVSCRVVKTA